MAPIVFVRSPVDLRFCDSISKIIYTLLLSTDLPGQAIQDRRLYSYVLGRRALHLHNAGCALPVLTY